jgi:ATP-binding cassette subfamily F protein 3
MSLAQLSDITFGYPGNELFEGLSWQINAGERIGLVGPNGCGKSTLLKLLTGELRPDSGDVVRARGARAGYLRQSLPHGGERTLLDELLAPFENVLKLHEELMAQEKLLHTDHSEPQLARYAALQEQYTAQDGYTLEARVRMLLADVGFAESDLARNVDTLSGGERGRLELAKVLVQEPELLLLDEPTNHLDITAVEKLEAFLRDYAPGKAVVLVSHDRTFLQSVCNTIVDVATGEIDAYAMRYDAYVAERGKRRERQLMAFRRQQEEIARQEEFIRRNIAGQKTKQAQSRRKMLEKLERLERPDDAWGSAVRIGLRFSAGDHAGPKDAIVAERLELGWDGAPPLIAPLDLTLYRGDRVGLVGPNGAGKTTLLKALLGQEKPRGGRVTRGPGVRIGYYDQKHRELDDERSLVEEIQSVRPDLTPDPVRNFLARLRFFGDDVFRKVKGLSGGERSRLALGKMMLVPRNLLALDEPTNHLDLPACEVLEDALADYDGTLLVVSHDRYFLDKVVKKVIIVENGRATLEVGNYSEVRARLKAKPARVTRGGGWPSEGPQRSGGKRGQSVTSAASEGGRESPPLEDPAKADRAQVRELAQKEKRQREQNERRFHALEAEIGGLEVEHAHVKEQLAKEHGDNWQRLHELVEEERKLGERLRSKMGEWEKLGRLLGM